SVVRDGRIELPAGYAEAVKGPVRVIVLFEGNSDADARRERDELDELMDNPIRVPGFVPLTRDEAHERR
ncbi:MAG TPA: hypothetical protein VF170_07550, partial [Planctomycetaceae bacterium]